MSKLAIVVCAVSLLSATNGATIFGAESHPDITRNITMMYQNVEKIFNDFNKTTNFDLATPGTESLQKLNYSIVNMTKAIVDNIKSQKNGEKDFVPYVEYWSKAILVAVAKNMKGCLELQKIQLRNIPNNLKAKLHAILIHDILDGSQNCENFINYKSSRQTRITRDVCYGKLQGDAKTILDNFVSEVRRTKEALRNNDLGAINVKDCRPHSTPEYYGLTNLDSLIKNRTSSAHS